MCASLEAQMCMTSRSGRGHPPPLAPIGASFALACRRRRHLRVLRASDTETPERNALGSKLRR
eukprot:607664-Alexandrium_andersonii.AAC.1